MSQSNVIDFAEHLKKAKKLKEIKKTSTGAAVVDIVERRKEVISQERRKLERTILTEFFGAFLVIPQKGLQKILMYDISENGISFDIEPEVGKLNVGEIVAARIYLSRKAFFTINVIVKNVRFISDEKVYRHGCAFEAGSVNEVALRHFVKFVENVSLDLREDSGDWVSSISKK